MESSSIAERVRTQLKRHHRKTDQCRFATLFLKALQIVLAGTIPILALLNPSASRPAVNGVLGALIVIIEGFQHSFQFEQYWMRYRRCAHELEREVSLHAARAGRYAGAHEPDKTLAEQIEALLSRHYDRGTMRKLLAN